MVFKVDKDNRMILIKRKRRIFARGEFALDRYNQLLFIFKEPPAWRKKYNLPREIIYTGRWCLDKEHNLVLDISQDKNFPQKEPLVLRGEIISTDRDELTFMLKTYEERKIYKVQILKFSGRWFSEQYNQINFLVKKKTLPDTLIFKNSWEINPQQKLTYTYEKTDLKTKTESFCSFTLEGFWQINSENRLTYILEKGINSCFDFSVQLESPNLYPREGVIKYRIGIGLKKKDTKIISLYGTWQISKEGKLLFLMDYGEGKIKKIEFGLIKRFSTRAQIEFMLTNKDKQPLG
ncbi:MAG: hypothetical protein N2Z79_03930, partial [Candidatus Omnitrophica bacterium]|nr:hypothetical protein [Candidatus Omnitrophota bacterium]